MELEFSERNRLYHGEVLAIPTRYGAGTPLDRRLWLETCHYIPIPKDCPGIPEALAACDHVRKQAPSVFWCVRDRNTAKSDAEYVANTIHALKHYGHVHGKYGGIAGKRCALQILSILEDSCQTRGHKNKPIPDMSINIFPESWERLEISSFAKSLIQKLVFLADRKKLRDFKDIALAMEEGTDIGGYILGVPKIKPEYQLDFFFDLVRSHTFFREEELAMEDKDDIPPDYLSSLRKFRLAVADVRDVLEFLPVSFSGRLFVDRNGNIVLPTKEIVDSYSFVPDADSAAPSM